MPEITEITENYFSLRFGHGSLAIFNQKFRLDVISGTEILLTSLAPSSD